MSEEETFKMRYKSIQYDFDIGDDYTLSFSISKSFRKGQPEIEVDLEIVENLLSYEQMSKMVQIIAKEAYRLGKEENGGKDEQ